MIAFIFYMCRIFPVLEMGPIISTMLLLQNRYVAIIAELYWSMTQIFNKPLFLFEDWLQLKTEDTQDIK
jgi:hypothetical protein